MERTGKLLIITGVFMVIAGIIALFFGDKLRFLGRLPGDIRIEKENFRLYFPVTTMILASILLSFILWLLRKFF